MLAPPAYVAEPERLTPGLSGDAYLAWLVREARAADPALREIPKRRLLDLAREFAAARELDRRDREAHQQAVAEFGTFASNFWPLVSRFPQTPMVDPLSGWMKR